MRTQNLSERFHYEADSQSSRSSSDWSESTANEDAYYNPRFDPANFLEGPLSNNPATRLRQMLARPGIIVTSFAICTRTPLISLFYL